MEKLRPDIDSELHDQTSATFIPLSSLYSWAAAISSSWNAFLPFPPPWLLISKHHSQNHCLSGPPGSRCTCRPPPIQSDINKEEVMCSHEKRERGEGWEICTWIRAFLMTLLTSSLHSATSGFCSSRLDEKASRCDRKYSAQKTGNAFGASFSSFLRRVCSVFCSAAPRSACYWGNNQIYSKNTSCFLNRIITKSKGRELRAMTGWGCNHSISSACPCNVAQRRLKALILHRYVREVFYKYIYHSKQTCNCFSTLTVSLSGWCDGILVNQRHKGAFGDTLDIKSNFTPHTFVLFFLWLRPRSTGLHLLVTQATFTLKAQVAWIWLVVWPRSDSFSRQCQQQTWHQI